MTGAKGGVSNTAPVSNTARSPRAYPRTGPPYHDRADCDPGPCVYHSPSSHHMDKWPTSFCGPDRMWFGLVERICPHGVGHPDPDSVAWFRMNMTRSEIDRGYVGTHGCDGDCTVSGYVKTLRETTPCARCGGSPIEYHKPSHVDQEHRRVSSLVASGLPWKTIKAEIDSCTPLCRSCHMLEDGRLKSLHTNKPNQPGISHPPKPCVVCQKLYKPLRQGQCYACYERHRVGGRAFRHNLSDGCCLPDLRHPYTCEWCDGEWLDYSLYDLHFSDLTHKNVDHPYANPVKEIIDGG